MPEGEKKAGESSFCKNKLLLLELLLYLREECFAQGEVFGIGPGSLVAEHWQTHDTSLPVCKAPDQLSLARQRGRDGLVELQGKVTHHLDVLPC